MTDGLVLSRTAFAAADRAAAAAVDAQFGQAGLHWLPLADGTHGPHAPDDLCVNFYTARPGELFDRLAVGPSVALMDNNWARVFLRYALSLIKTGGRLIVLRNPAGAKGSHGFISSRGIDAYLTPCAERLAPAAPDAAEALVYLRGSTLPAAPPSVLSSFLDPSASWTDRLASYFAGEPGGTSGAREAEARLNLAGGPFDWRPEALDPSRPSEKVIADGINALGSPDLAFRRYIASLHAYLIDGVRYKPAIVAHILKNCVARESGLTIADVGSAYGLVPIELCLDDRPAIAGALAVDVGYGYTLGACRLFENFAGALDGRFKFALNSAEDFALERTYDAVSFIGSLLYVAKDALTATLDKAWRAVAPGGVLLVHENIRQAGYSRDYQLMFAADELDGHLERYGAIRYFMSTGAVELPRDKVGDKTVFRVVTKRQ